MSNSYFQFKQFCIRHDRCAMKVGTDGVLLGAWGCVEGQNILDIGTGTGIIALMAAQRNQDAKILGIDIDEVAVQQARENVAESPYYNRVSCIQYDALTFSPATRYDSILCNPPFFKEDTLPSDSNRALARNSKSLPFPQLIHKVSTLLTNIGRFSVIIPSQHMSEFVGLCLTESLHLERRCLVRSVPHKSPGRVLLTFSKEKVELKENQEISVTTSDGLRSHEYVELTKAFYL